MTLHSLQDQIHNFSSSRKWHMVRNTRTVLTPFTYTVFYFSMLHGITIIIFGLYNQSGQNNQLAWTSSGNYLKNLGDFWNVTFQWWRSSIGVLNFYFLSVKIAPTKNMIILGIVIVYKRLKVHYETIELSPTSIDSRQ